MLFDILFIQEVDVKHLGEVLAELMRGSTLDSSSTDWDVDLSGCREVSTSESFIIRLGSLNNWNCKEFFVDLSISIKDRVNMICCLLFINVSGVTLLPKELSGSDERSGVLELPSNNV
jgi:hypothetical protein